MPATRSSTRNTIATISTVTTEGSLPASTMSIAAKHKRKAEPLTTSKSREKRARPLKSAPASTVNVQTASSFAEASTQDVTSDEPVLVPAVLTFSFEDAKKHLINVDSRFEDLFNKMECKPFEHLEQVHPFRALVTSILGQQISWLAARSINHKFLRLYDPSIPEDHASYKSKEFFPTPRQVAKTDTVTLRTAGLSGRKAEYVQDLAARFADGRLSTEKLIKANDEDLAKMLIEVRGIGPWTVDMFAIFSLRRPNILPVGDLGVQRGVLRWFLSLHSPSHTFGISPEKVGSTSSKKRSKKEVVSPVSEHDPDLLPIFGQELKSSDPDVSESKDTLEHSTSSTSLPSSAEFTGINDVASIPPPFTPSIKDTLNKSGNIGGLSVPSLPDGLSIAELKSRTGGKKKIKGAFLTPKEMEDLTECWKPYRSVAVYYMWSLAEGET